MIAGYRALTGKAVLLPKWAYGFWQSRERYKTQAELVGVVDEYRKRKIPLDNIVQDWFYWKEDSMGFARIRQDRFPDPAGHGREMHAQNAHLMISVWPKFYPTTANFKELDAAGLHVPRQPRSGRVDWVGPGYLNSFYDPYSKAARDIFWRQVNEKLNRTASMRGGSMPPSPTCIRTWTSSQRRCAWPTAMGPAAEFFNSYPLVHAGGVYEGRAR